MLTSLLALTLQAAVPQAAPSAAAPTAEAEALGRRLAESGTLGALLPMMIAKDTEEMVAAHPELSDAEKAELRAVAGEQASAELDRVMSAEGHAFATILSLDDLRMLVATAESGAAKRQRAALPKVIMATMQTAGEVDFKRDTLAAFCAKTGKACAKK